MPEPLVIFTPQAIIAALERMTDQEAFELDSYARKGTPDQFCELATAWLLAHGFSGSAIMLVEKEVS